MLSKNSIMLSISAKIRKELGDEVKTLRSKGILPAVLYGVGIKNLSLQLDEKEFKKIYEEAGESSLISLGVDPVRDYKGKGKAQTEQISNGVEEKEFLVLVHDIQRDPVSDKIIHIDFYQPSLKEETEVTVPLVFEGESPAVKELSGTLVKNIQEVAVKALPQNLPHEIKVNIDCLKTFEDDILIKNLKVPEGVKILKEPGEIVASVSPPEKVEEELEKPIEEKVEEVEKAEKPEKEGKETKEEEKEK